MEDHSVQGIFRTVCDGKGGGGHSCGVSWKMKDCENGRKRAVRSDEEREPARARFTSGRRHLARTRKMVRAIPLINGHLRAWRMFVRVGDTRLF